jgi:hypothetical protein
VRWFSPGGERWSALHMGEQRHAEIIALIFARLTPARMARLT